MPSIPVVLLIEDDPDITAIIQFLLNEKGCVVHINVATEPEKILELSPDLIILDHWLGDRLGADICQRLKENPHTRNIPVILCSAVSNLPAVRENCLADAFLTKPFDLQDFQQLIDSFIIADK